MRFLKTKILGGPEVLTSSQRPTALVVTPAAWRSPETLSSGEAAAERTTPPEFNLPTSQKERDALLGLVRLDQHTNTPLGDLIVDPELAVAVLDFELRSATDTYRNVFGQDSTIHGEADLIEASLKAAEAIAGILATPMGVTDVTERDALEQSMVQWLARAKRSDHYIEQGVKTHTDWEESRSTIALRSAPAFSDPRFEPISMQTIMSMTLHRIDTKNRIDRLAEAVISDDPAELGKSLGQAFEHPDKHVAAGLRGKAFFELAAASNGANTEQKQWALLQAKHHFDIAFASVDIDDEGPEAELSPEQAVQLRLYGQTIHDLAELRDDPTDRVSVSMRKRAITYLQKSLQNHTVYLDALQAEKGDEDTARMDMAKVAQVYDAEGFTTLRNEVARLNVELFNGWVRVKDYKQDIDNRGRIISNFGEERNILNERLRRLTEGLPDTVSEPDNPDDPRSVDERIRTRLEQIATTLPRLHEEIRRVNAEKQKIEDSLAEIEAKRAAVVAKETNLLRSINKHVRKRLQPVVQQLRSNRLGQIVPGNEQYFAAKDILRCFDERDKSDYFTVLYMAELDVLQHEIEQRKALAREALQHTERVDATTAPQTA